MAYLAMFGIILVWNLRMVLTGDEGTARGIAEKLLADYDPSYRPVLGSGYPTNLTVSPRLLRIVEVDSSEAAVTIIVMFNKVGPI